MGCWFFSFPSHLPFLLRWRYRATRRHQRCCGHRCQCHLQRQNCKYFVQDSGKLSRKKTFANFAVLWLYANFFPQTLGRGVLWQGKSLQSPKVFSTKIVFSPIRESFLCENCIFTNSRKFSPSKVSRYMVCTVLSSSSYTFTYMHMHAFFPNTHNPCSFTAWSTACHGGRDQQEDTQGRHRNRRGVL